MVVVTDQVVDRWFKTGMKVTGLGVPHNVTTYLIRNLAEHNDLHTFVETGSGSGLMVSNLLHDFDRIFSCELYPPHFVYCHRLFSAEYHVTILFGSSEKRLEDIVTRLGGPALFFLDAHYSGPGSAQGTTDTPILSELDTVLGSEYSNLIVVDDARLFGTEKDYPTLAALEKIAFDQGYDRCDLVADTIVIYQSEVMEVPCLLSQ